MADWQWPVRWHGLQNLVRLPEYIAARRCQFQHLLRTGDYALGSERARRWRSMSAREIVLELRQQQS